VKALQAITENPTLEVGGEVGGVSQIATTANINEKRATATDYPNRRLENENEVGIRYSLRKLGIAWMLACTAM
jgi:hypothetical protein